MMTLRFEPAHPRNRADRFQWPGPRAALFGLALAAHGLHPSSSLAQTPPQVTDAALAQAARIAAMPDGDPPARMNQLLAARDLDEASLFALAATHPGLVEQLVVDKYKLAVDYLGAIPAPELHRVRRGETVIRTARVLKGTELKLALQIAESFKFKKFKEKKLEAMRVSPLEARVYRVEVTVALKKNKTTTGTIELCWPSTPERDEQSREALSRHFGARPSRTGTGAGSSLSVQDGSFEADDPFSAGWIVLDGITLGAAVPAGEVTLDGTNSVDGSQSIRFYATEKTRRFPEVVQQLRVPPGAHVRARTQFKAERLRVEYLQQEDTVGLSLAFMDDYGVVIGDPVKALGRLSTHAWELLEVQGQAPDNAAYVRIGLMSAVSGTSWFDAVTADVVR